MSNSTIWDRFEGIATPTEVKESKDKVSFTPIETGSYIMVLEELAPSESKTGLPMVKGKFRTDSNRVVFYNQMLQNTNNPTMTAINIAEAIKFIEDLTGKEITFTSLGELAKDIQNVVLGKEYKVKVTYGKNDLEKNFPKLTIEDRLEDMPL